MCVFPFKSKSYPKWPNTIIKCDSKIIILGTSLKNAQPWKVSSHSCERERERDAETLERRVFWSRHIHEDDERNELFIANCLFESKGLHRWNTFLHFVMCECCDKTIWEKSITVRRMLSSKEESRLLIATFEQDSKFKINVWRLWLCFIFWGIANIKGDNAACISQTRSMKWFLRSQTFDNF